MEKDIFVEKDLITFKPTNASPAISRYRYGENERHAYGPVKTAILTRIRVKAGESFLYEERLLIVSAEERSDGAKHVNLDSLSSSVSTFQSSAMRKRCPLTRSILELVKFDVSDVTVAPSGRTDNVTGFTLRAADEGDPISTPVTVMRY